MAINLPWFPNGDDTAPPNESIVHRYFNDYYQTYDVLSSGNFSLIDNFIRVRGCPFFADSSLVKLPQSLRFPRGGGNGNGQFIPSILIERYFPVDFPRQDYALRLYLYLAQFSGYTVETSAGQLNTEVNLSFPIIINHNANIYYLVSEDSLTLFNLSWARETVKAGQEWTPRYTVIANSLVEQIIDDDGLNPFLSNFTGLYYFYMSENSWCLPEPTITGLIPEQFRPFQATRIDTATNNRWNQTLNASSQGEELRFYHQDPIELERPLDYTDLYYVEVNNTGRYGIDAINPQQLIDDFFLANDGQELIRPMADSVRIKEIHAALEANYWGNGQDKFFKIFGDQTFLDDPLALFSERQSYEEFLSPFIAAVIDPNTVEKPPLPEVGINTIPQMLNRLIKIMGGLLGVHTAPSFREATYVSPTLDRESGQITRNPESDPVYSTQDYYVLSDKDIQTKLGLWPAVSNNYAQDEEGVGRPPKREFLNNLAGVASDLFELSTRSSLVTEGARIATLITQDQTFEIIKGMGLIFSVEEVELFEGNFISVPRFNGGASLSAQNLAIAQAIDRSSCTTVLPGSLLDTIGVPQDSPIRTPSGGASRRV